MKYDPNWLQKAKAKQVAKDLASLSHIENGKPHFGHSTMLCGKGWGAKGHPSITIVQFPSIDSLPTCRSCREKFLTSINVQFDSNGYPTLNN